MKTGILHCDTGNLFSIKSAIEEIGVKPIFLKSPVETFNYPLILPGVGNFAHVIREIRKRNLDEFIFEKIKKGIPLLGICVGMQILFEKSEEGNEAGLGVLKGIVQKIKADRLPHIGWNRIEILENSRILKGLKNRYFYFLHSYKCVPENNIKTSDVFYYERFAASVESENVYGVQFHPEKSGKEGILILKNFFKI